MHPPEHLRGDGVSKAERGPLGRWSPSGSDDYVRTYRALINTLAQKFRAMLASGDVLSATDEEEAIDEVKVYASRLGNQTPEVLQEATDRLLRTAKLFYGIWAMNPEIAPEPYAPVLSKVDLVEERPT